jgi:hypothetical protein
MHSHLSFRGHLLPAITKYVPNSNCLDLHCWGITRLVQLCWSVQMLHPRYDLKLKGSQVMSKRLLDWSSPCSSLTKPAPAHLAQH